MNNLKSRTLCFFSHFQAKTFYASFSQKEDFKDKFLPRNRFDLPVKFDKRIWYPKHMGVQLKRMEGKLRTVDLIIEVMLDI